MGARKRKSAEIRKAEKKQTTVAKLNRVPSSPRKMRLVADLIRGMQAEKALIVLTTMRQEGADKVYNLLKSAISNWQQKHEGVRMEDAQLYIESITIDGGRMLKRLRPAPFGRGYRIRKRSNH
ncbi:MAG: 50S ribosomal protein L22, partial [Bacteroidetes bacterium 38_7]